MWITGACSRGSSTSPTRTGVYTRVFRSVLPFARCWRRSEKPWEENKGCIKQRGRELVHDVENQLIYFIWMPHRRF